MVTEERCEPQGVAGIGKTSLIAPAASRGALEGVRVLGARGDQLEQHFPWGVAIQDVEGTITAADGSQLFAEAEGQLIPTGTPGLFEIVGAVTFVGGTGRFEGASGFAEGSGTFNLATGQGTNILDGTLVLAVG